MLNIIYLKNYQMIKIKTICNICCNNYDEINIKLLNKITNLKTDNFADTTNRKIWNSLYLLVSKVI